MNEVKSKGVSGKAITILFVIATVAFYSWQIHP